MIRILKSKFIRRIIILGFSVILMGAIFFIKTNRLPPQVAGTVTNPLLVTNKFCDDPTNLNQAGCISFIPSVLAQAINSPFQNVNSPVSISGNLTVTPPSGTKAASFNDGAGPCCAGYYTISINEGYGANQPTLQFHDSGAAEGQIVLQRDIGGGQRGFLFKSTQTSMGGLFTGNLLVNGKLGIGTPTPGAALEVDGGNRSLRIRNTGAAAGKYWAIGPDTNNNFTIYNQTNLGAWLADSSPSSWRFTSDQRLKTNIQTLSGEKGLAAIEKLNPVSFNWIGRNPSATQLGLVAQQVQSIFPELVSEGPSSTIELPDGSTQTITNTLGLDYTGLIPSLIKAIQEQQEQIQNQQQAINELRQEIQQLKQGR